MSNARNMVDGKILLKHGAGGRAMRELVRQVFVDPMAATGGADGVGKATTRTVVTASIAVIISDFFLTKLFMIF